MNDERPDVSTGSLPGAPDADGDPLPSEDGSLPGGPTPDDGGEAIAVRYQLSATDFRSATIQMTRLSVGTVALGSYLACISILPIASGELFSWLSLLFGLSLVTGLYCLPFIWLAIRRRRDLVFADHQLRADGSGIDVVTPLTSTHQSWQTFRRVRELSGMFLLDYGTGANAIVPARAFDPATLERFRGLLVSQGKLDRPSQLTNWLKGAAIGAVVALAFMGVIAVMASR